MIWIRNWQWNLIDDITVCRLGTTFATSLGVIGPYICPICVNIEARPHIPARFTDKIGRISRTKYETAAVLILRLSSNLILFDAGCLNSGWKNDPIVGMRPHVFWWRSKWLLPLFFMSMKKICGMKNTDEGVHLFRNMISN